MALCWHGNPKPKPRPNVWVQSVVVLSLLLSASSSWAQVSGRTYWPRTFSAGSLPTCNATTKGWVYEVYDGADADDCSTGSSTHAHSCQCDGSSWVALALSSNASPGGSDGHVQYNNGGAFGGEAALFWDDAADELGLGTATPSYELHVKGSSGATTVGVEGPNDQTVAVLLDRKGTGTQAWQWQISGGGSDLIAWDKTNTLGPFHIETNTSSNTLVIDSNERIGINTASPAYVVVAEGATADRIRLVTTTGDASLNAKTNNSDLALIALGASDGGLVYDYGNTNNLLTFGSDGTVIVGSTEATAPTCDTLGKQYVDTSGAQCWCDGSSWQKIVGSGTCA